MHEMSLCENVLQVIEQHAKAQQFQRVTKIWLEIGALAGVEAEAMRFCFDIVMQASIAKGAELEIIELPGVAWCVSCGQNVVIRQLYDACPNCGAGPLEILGGNQLRIKEMEVE